jgi:phosphoenolpyruvate carboxylase
MPTPPVSRPASAAIAALAGPLTLKAARGRLRTHAARIDSDPQTNSVFLLAQELFLALDDGRLALGELATLVREAHEIALDARAARLRARHGLQQPEDANTWDAVRARLEALGSRGPHVLDATLARPSGGIVFTAHPTFALSAGLRLALAQRAGDPGPATRRRLTRALAGETRDSAARLTLAAEHGEVQAALGHATDALAQLGTLMLDAARRADPKAWRSVKPALPTLASWVGYDLDGRTDIHWWHSFALRLQEKAAALARHAAALTDFAQVPGQPPAHTEALGALVRQLSAAEARTRREAALFARDLSDPARLVEAANTLTAPGPDRLTDLTPVIDTLERLASDTSVTDDLAVQLKVQAALMRTLGLGTAHIHLRVNAAQVHSVLARDLGLQATDDEPGRQALRQLAVSAASAPTLPVGFGDLLVEQATARRQVLLCAQILKHVDATTPIRFLIAESENPATVMGVLLMARQYGIADRLDISPLFETPEALEIGGRFIERLLEEETFLAHIRARGWLAVQFGFSDSGRFIGQIAGNMAIERLHNLIGRALAVKAQGVGLLLFNTHGESMGRGAWPGPFARRFDHLLTPWTRAGLAARGQGVRHEFSFQGGDGFLHFATPALARSTMAHCAAHFLDLADPPQASDPARDDPFYARTDFVWDFYRALRAWHERLFKNREYGHALSDFAPAFVARAGSRQVRRPGGAAGPRALRAISHNATLQQLGIPLNTAAGIGSAVRRETDRLVDLVNTSPRMRSLIEMAALARILTSVPALRSYGEVYDPGVWLQLGRAGGPDAYPACRAVSRALADYETATALRRTANVLAVDLAQFDGLLSRLNDAPSVGERHERRLDLHVLHAVRQALMMRAFALAGRIPALSARHDVSRDDILALVTAMRLDEAVGVLREVFPLSRDASDALRGLQETGHHTVDPEAAGYRRVHETLTAPLASIADILHEIGLAISHAYDAHG